MKLIEPTELYADQIRNFRQEFLDSGDELHGAGPLIEMDDPLQWVHYSRLCTHPETVPDGLVPATQFILVRESDQKILGTLQIRHVLNDYLAMYGGHIGYSVAPSERRKGYASLMLSMALPHCRELGIDQLLITCRDDNVGSRKTILANGGRYESTVHEPSRGVNLERYWINTSSDNRQSVSRMEGEQR